jgi:hypothetical protein
MLKAVASLAVLLSSSTMAVAAECMAKVEETSALIGRADPPTDEARSYLMRLRDEAVDLCQAGHPEIATVKLAEVRLLLGLPQAN